QVGHVALAHGGTWRNCHSRPPLWCARGAPGRPVRTNLALRCWSICALHHHGTPECGHRLAMTLLTVRHTTTYRYKQPVSFGEHRMMFRPRDSYDQKLLEAWLTIKPEPTTIRWVHDVFGNCVTIADFHGRPAKELRFESNIWLDHAPSNAPVFEIEDYAQKYPFTYTPEEISDLLPATTPQYPDPDHAIHNWVRQFLRKGGPTDTGMLLMTRTYAFKEGFPYERRTEPGTRPPAETLRLKRGSCRYLALL